MGYLLEDMNQLLIPHFTDGFIKRISNIVKSSHTILEESEKTYKEAQETLTKAVGYISDSFSV